MGLAYAAPGALLTLRDPLTGLSVSVGVLCVAALGLAGPRRQRALAVVVGGLAGFSFFVGSCVAGTPVLAVMAIFVLCLAAAVTSTRYRLGPAVLNLGLPVVGAGLSESGPAAGATVGALMFGGAVYAWLVSLCWAERPASPRPPAGPRPSTAFLLDYGIRLGLVGALAAAGGFVAGIDHPGWACCAGLLVSRPSSEVTRSRGTGRVVSVLLGAAVATVIEAAGPGPRGLALVVVVAIVGAASTSGSRWYVTGGFTTLLVITLLIVANPGTSSQWWFLERSLATVYGVLLAYVFMSLLPKHRAAAAGTGPAGR